MKAKLEINHAGLKVDNSWQEKKNKTTTKKREPKKTKKTSQIKHRNIKDWKHMKTASTSSRFIYM